MHTKNDLASAEEINPPKTTRTLLVHHTNVKNKSQKIKLSPSNFIISQSSRIFKGKIIQDLISVKFIMPDTKGMQTVKIQPK